MKFRSDCIFIGLLCLISQLFYSIQCLGMAKDYEEDSFSDFSSSYAEEEFYVLDHSDEEEIYDHASDNSFDKSQVACLVRNGSTFLPKNSQAKAGIGGLAVGGTGGIIAGPATAVALAYASTGIFLTGTLGIILGPMAIAPAVTYGGYYAKKRQQRLHRQKKMVQLAFYPEHQREKLMDLYLANYKPGHSLSHVYQTFYDEAMKRKSAFCHEGGSFRSFKQVKSQLILVSRRKSAMTPLEELLDGLVGEYKEIEEAFHNLVALNSQKAKYNRSISLKKKDQLMASMIEKKKFLKKFKRNLGLSLDNNELKIYLTENLDYLRQETKQMVDTWIDSIGQRMAEDNLIHFQQTRDSYPFVTSQEKKRWKKRQIRKKKQELNSL